MVLPDEHPTLLIAEVLHYVLAQIIAHQGRVPLRRVEQPLDALRIRLSDRLCKLPAVLALDPSELPQQVASDPLPSLRASEAVRYSPVQRLQRLRPPNLTGLVLRSSEGIVVMAGFAVGVLALGATALWIKVGTKRVRQQTHEAARSEDTEVSDQ